MHGLSCSFQDFHRAIDLASRPEHRPITSTLKFEGLLESGHECSSFQDGALQRRNFFPQLLDFPMDFAHASIGSIKLFDPEAKYGEKSMTLGDMEKYVVAHEV